MAQRYTNRDCRAALIRVAASERAHGVDIGVVLPPKSDLLECAERFGVPVRSYVAVTQDAESIPCYSLEEVGSAYGGGVRPTLYKPGSSGEYTPRWWVKGSLGPGATNRETFCLICSAVERGLEQLPTLPQEVAP